MPGEEGSPPRIVQKNKAMRRPVSEILKNTLLDDKICNAGKDDKNLYGMPDN
jgi:hypothetical protein